jgi:4-oxalocrotonate tautomerase
MKLVQLVLSDRQKQIEGEHMRSVTRVIVERVGSGQGGTGGRLLTTEDVKALAAGARPTA